MAELSGHLGGEASAKGHALAGEGGLKVGLGAGPGDVHRQAKRKARTVGQVGMSMS